MRNKLIAYTAAILAIFLSSCLVAQPGMTGVSPTLPARPEVLSFEAQPSKIESGSAVTLQWDVKGADNVTIDNGIGAVSSMGRLEVKPDKSKAYNLTASNTGGEMVSSVIIDVQPVMKVASPAATYSTYKPDFPVNSLPKLGPNESYVFFLDAVMVNADNNYIVLRNNPAALNPTWAELKEFLKEDKSDAHAYVTGKYTCGDFAEALHNNAEAAGIRTAIVAIELKSAGMTAGVINHSLDAFETTDRGTVYIDDTASSQGFFADKIVNLTVGGDYLPQPIFPPQGQAQIWPSMGKVEAIDIFQW